MAKKDTAPQDATSQDEFQVQIDELTADVQRISADFANFKRRASDERQQLSDVAKTSVVSQLLPLFDNLERALTHMPDDLQGNAWAKGVAQLAKQFEEALNKLGVTRIPAKGQRFDPNLHEAVSYEDGDGEEIVLEELQAGYQVNGQVVRHSIVKVGHGAAASVPPAPEEVAEVLEAQKSDEPKENEEPGV